MKSVFSIYHPITNLIYLIIVCILTLVFIHPVFIGINIICAVLSSGILLGYKKMWSSLKYGLFVFIVMAIINPFVNTLGETVLFYIGKHPIALEAIIYGMTSGGTLMCMFLWISCFGSFFNNGKLMYLFSGFIPKMALMLSMSIKTIGDVKYRISSLLKTQKAVETNRSDKILEKFKSISRMSTVLLGWTLEDSIDTIYSMKSRGYGSTKRTFYSRYRWKICDTISTIILSLCLLMQFLFSINNAVIQYYPTIEISKINPLALFGYCVILLFPVLIELLEEVRLWELR